MFCPSSLVAGITALAIAIAENKSSEEIDVLGAIFTQLGDTLTTISAQRSFIGSKCQSEDKKIE